MAFRRNLANRAVGTNNAQRRFHLREGRQRQQGCSVLAGRRTQQRKAKGRGGAGPCGPSVQRGAHQRRPIPASPPDENRKQEDALRRVDAPIAAKMLSFPGIHAGREKEGEGEGEKGKTTRSKSTEKPNETPGWTSIWKDNRPTLCQRLVSRTVMK